jgi:hypothetical protein
MAHYQGFKQEYYSNYREETKEEEPPAVQVLLREFQHVPYLSNGMQSYPVTTMNIHQDEFHLLVTTNVGRFRIAKDKNEDYARVLAEGDILIDDQTTYKDPEPPAIYVPNPMPLMQARVAYYQESSSPATQETRWSPQGSTQSSNKDDSSSVSSTGARTQASMFSSAVCKCKDCVPGRQASKEETSTSTESYEHSEGLFGKQGSDDESINSYVV